MGKSGRACASEPAERRMGALCRRKIGFPQNRERRQTGKIVWRGQVHPVGVTRLIPRLLNLRAQHFKLRRRALVARARFEIIEKRIALHAVISTQ